MNRNCFRLQTPGPGNKSTHLARNAEHNHALPSFPRISANSIRFSYSIDLAPIVPFITLRKLSRAALKRKGFWFSCTARAFENDRMCIVYLHTYKQLKHLKKIANSKFDRREDNTGRVRKILATPYYANSHFHYYITAIPRLTRFPFYSYSYYTTSETSEAQLPRENIQIFLNSEQNK